MLLCALLSGVVCDNMQLCRDAFTKVVVGDTAYHAKDLCSNSVLKISYPGYLVYALDEYCPGHFRLVDRTVYLGGEGGEDLRVVVDEVLRPLGVSGEIVKMVLVMANLVVLVQVLLALVERRTESAATEKAKAE